MIGGEVVSKDQLQPSVYLSSVLCSGVMISPRHVLTAGHCVERTPGQFLIDLDQVMNITWHGIDRIAGVPMEIRVPIAARHTHPYWRDNLHDLGDPDAAADMPDAVDLGIYTLKYDLPIPVARLPQHGMAEQTAAIRVSGSGCFDHQSQPSGVLKAALLRIQEVQAGRLVFGTRMLANGRETTNLAGLCPGDSGGGAYFVDSEDTATMVAAPILLGVASTMVASPSEPDEVIDGVIARIDHRRAKDWINQVLSDERRELRVFVSLTSLDMNIATLETIENLRDSRLPQAQKLIQTVNALRSDEFLHRLRLTDETLFPVARTIVQSQDNNRLAHEIVHRELSTWAEMDPILWASIESVRRMPMALPAKRMRLMFYLENDARFATLELRRTGAEALADLENAIRDAPSVLKSVLTEL